MRSCRRRNANQAEAAPRRWLRRTSAGSRMSAWPRALRATRSMSALTSTRVTVGQRTARLRHPHRDVAGAACDVDMGERPRQRRPDLGDESVLPCPVQAERHQIVHQVIATRRPCGRRRPPGPASRPGERCGGRSACHRARRAYGALLEAARTLARRAPSVHRGRSVHAHRDARFRHAGLRLPNREFAEMEDRRRQHGAGVALPHARRRDGRDCRRRPRR